MPDLRAMQVTIRKAEPRDVPAMLALVYELAVFEKEPEAVTASEAEMLEDGFGKKPVWFGWVACRSDDRKIGRSDDESRTPSSDQILGIAICYERYSTWKGRCLYLEDIVVTEAARGQGIGERLFRTCVEHGVKEHYRWMRWQVLDWNTGAIRFYEKLGAEVSAGWLNGDLSPEQMRALVA